MALELTDIKVDVDGDLILGDSGDLVQSSTAEAVASTILFRLKTAHNDFPPSQFMGANLNEYLGETNSRRNAQLIAESVRVSLSQDSFLAAGSYGVEVIPISLNQVAIFVTPGGIVSEDGKQLVVSASLNYLTGEMEAINNL